MPKKVAKKAVKKVATTVNDPLDKVISDLEQARNSKVIVYITGDRKPEQLLSTQVASDILPYFKKILRKIDHTSKITLALYTNGGHLETPWPLVNLIREHCDEFEVVVLSKALSAGTMIALGADQIVLTRYAHLSPIDPAANIQDGNNQLKHIEIEDVIGYVDFIKEKVGISEQTALADIMKELTKEIAPTVLGSTNRTHSLVRRLAKNLLHTHAKALPERQSREIIEHLTQKLFSHKHLISRNEAKDIGFDGVVDCPDSKNEKIIENLLDKYIDYLDLETDFNPQEVLGAEDRKEVNVRRAVIHSLDSKYTFESKYILAKIPDPSGNVQVNLNLAGDKWIIT
ncbi:MAG: hypothetical protein WA014_01170 [Minisyncoccia bacterium]